MNRIAFKRTAVMLALAASTGLGPAQQPPGLPPPPANPLIQLMQAQPPIDISSPVVATTAFDPPVIRPGEKCTFRVSLNAIETAVRWTQPIGAPPQLQLTPGARGQILRPVGATLKPLTTFNFNVDATSAGLYLIPRFTVEVYGQPVVVPDTGLEVTTDLEAHEPLRQLLLEPGVTNLFVGQSVPVRVLLPALASNLIEGAREVQINGDGFAVDKVNVRQSFTTLERAGKRLPAYIYETTVTAISAGKLTLSAQGFSAGRDFGGSIVITGPATIAGGPPQYVLLESDPVTVNVRLLPTAGLLPGFTGGIGHFTGEPPQLSTNRVRVGEPVEVLATIRGEPLARLQPADPPRVRGWQLFPAVSKGFVPANGSAPAGVVFAYAMIPQSEELRATPPIPFSYFDPERTQYVDLNIPSVPVTVLPAPDLTNAPLALETETDRPEEPRLSLTPPVTARGKTVARLRPVQTQPWFVAVQAAPLLGFAALWQWDRRRRFLEQHPEILRRRCARRALRKARRALHQAAAAQDGGRFARAAVEALQIAGAPRYPAHPHALVCADVLNLLPETQRHTEPGRVIRECFAAHDAANFSTAAANAAPLLALHPALEEILAQLEAQL